MPGWADPRDLGRDGGPGSSRFVPASPPPGSCLATPSMRPRESGKTCPHVPVPSCTGLRWDGTAWHSMARLSSNPWHCHLPRQAPVLRAPHVPPETPHHSCPAELLRPLCLARLDEGAGPRVRAVPTGRAVAAWRRASPDSMEEAGGETEARRGRRSWWQQGHAGGRDLEHRAMLRAVLRKHAPNPGPSAQLLSPSSVRTGALLAQSELLA